MTMTVSAASGNGTFAKEYLNNGLCIVTEEIPQVHSVSLGVWVRCGAKYESRKNAGISHFLEHMFFKGTKNRSAGDIASEIESVGGVLNAGTDKEYTVFYSVVLSEHLPLSVDLLSDMLFHSTFHIEEIQKEKSVVMEEIKMYEDSPDDLIHDIFMETYLKGAALGRSTLGTKETVGGLSRTDLKHFVGKHYVPRNMIVAAAGQLKHHHVVSLVRKAFAPANGQSRFSGNGAKEIVKINPEINIHQKETEQIHFCLGGRGLSQGHKDRYALSVMDSILGGGMSSRLFQKIREKEGLVYSISSFMPSYRQCGLFGVSAATSGKNLLRTLKLISRELASLREKGVTKKELSRAKEQIKGNILLNLESTSNRMTKIARSEFYMHRDVTLEETLRKFNSVTLDDVRRVAYRLLDPEKLSFAAIGQLGDDMKKKIEIIIRN